MDADEIATVAEVPNSPRRRISCAIDAGTMAGEYCVLEEIGHGGMGVVYLGEHPVIGKKAAIKVLRTEVSTNEDVVQRFVTEASCVNRICHPNIVDIFGFGKLPDGRSYFIMEYLEGEGLDHRLERGKRLSLGDALPILRQIANAVDAAHEEGIVHRDLKPENVFLARDRANACKVKVLDFGIAKLLAGSRRETQEGMILGTPLFMSPEQCRSQPVDHRADVYSFGVIAYRTLTGRYPFEGSDIPELLVQHSYQPVPSPSGFGLPAELNPILERALAKEPNERYNSLGALVDALSQLDITSAPVERRQPSRRFKRAHTPFPMKKLVAESSADPVAGWPAAANQAKTVSVVSAELVFGAGKKPSQGKVAALASTVQADASAGQAIPAIDFPLAARVHACVGLSPDGSLVVTAGESGVVFVWDQFGKPVAELEGHDSLVTQVDFAPSGQLFATGDQSGAIRVWSSVQRQLVRKFSGHEGPVSGLAFVEDHRAEGFSVRGHSFVGATLVSAGADGTLRVWDVRMGEARILSESAPIEQIAVDSHGLRIATRNRDGQMRIWDIVSESSATWSGCMAAVCAIAYSPDGQRVAAGCDDGSIVEWSISGSGITEPADMRILEGHRAAVDHLVYLAKTGSLVSAGHDGTLLSWDALTSASTLLDDLGTGVIAMAAASDSSLVATAAEGGREVRVVDVERPGTAYVHGLGQEVSTCRLSPGNNDVVATGGSARVLVVPAKDGRREAISRRSDGREVVLAEIVANVPESLAQQEPAPRKKVGMLRVAILLIVAALAAFAAGLAGFIYT